MCAYLGCRVSVTRVAERLVVDTFCYVVGYAGGTPALYCLLLKVDLLTYKTTLTLVLLFVATSLFLSIHFLR